MAAPWGAGLQSLSHAPRGAAFRRDAGFDALVLSVAIAEVAAVRRAALNTQAGEQIDCSSAKGTLNKTEESSR